MAVWLTSEPELFRPTSPQEESAMRTTAQLPITGRTALLVVAATMRGQSALDAFDPDANGTVYVVVVQPDGTLETAFIPKANGDVDSIAVSAEVLILRHPGPGHSYLTIQFPKPVSISYEK